MDERLAKIELFIVKHHVLSLATYAEGDISACSLFYAYDSSSQTFVVASDPKTTHIQHIQKHPEVAGTIVLETRQVGKIEGLQFRGTMRSVEGEDGRRLYYKAFPYALAMQPTLWEIKVTFFKLTDNRLGFGKKLIWQAALA